MAKGILKAARKATYAAALLMSMATLPVMAYAAGSYEVVYEGDARQLVSESEDFFEHFGAMLPGDNLSGSVVISNDGDSAQHVYFYTRPLDMANREEADALLDRIELSIYSESSDKVVYDGLLRADELNEAVHLGTFEPGDEDVLLFDLYVPAELTNEYAMAENAVNWVFATEEVPAETKDGWFYKTGDEMVRVVLIGSSALGVVASISLICVTRRRKHQEAQE